MIRPDRTGSRFPQDRFRDSCCPPGRRPAGSLRPSPVARSRPGVVMALSRSGSAPPRGRKFGQQPTTAGTGPAQAGKTIPTFKIHDERQPGTSPAPSNLGNSPAVASLRAGSHFVQSSIIRERNASHPACRSERPRLPRSWRRGASLGYTGASHVCRRANRSSSE